MSFSVKAASFIVFFVVKKKTLVRPRLSSRFEINKVVSNNDFVMSVSEPQILILYNLTKVYILQSDMLNATDLRQCFVLSLSWQTLQYVLVITTIIQVSLYLVLSPRLHRFVLQIADLTQHRLLSLPDKLVLISFPRCDNALWKWAQRLHTHLNLLACVTWFYSGSLPILSIPHHSHLFARPLWFHEDTPGIIYLCLCMFFYFLCLLRQCCSDSQIEVASLHVDRKLNV